MPLYCTDGNAVEHMQESHTRHSGMYFAVCTVEICRAMFTYWDCMLLSVGIHHISPIGLGVAACSYITSLASSKPTCIATFSLCGAAPTY